jgi:hypothetical protein
MMAAIAPSHTDISGIGVDELGRAEAVNPSAVSDSSREWTGATYGTSQQSEQPRQARPRASETRSSSTSEQQSSEPLSDVATPEGEVSKPTYSSEGPVSQSAPLVSSTSKRRIHDQVRQGTGLSYYDEDTLDNIDGHGAEHEEYDYHSSDPSNHRIQGNNEGIVRGGRRTYPVEGRMFRTYPKLDPDTRRRVKPGEILNTPDPQRAYDPDCPDGVPTKYGLMSNKARSMTVMKTHPDEYGIPDMATCLRNYTYQGQGPSNGMPRTERNQLFRLLEVGSSSDQGQTVNAPVYGRFYGGYIHP